VSDGADSCHVDMVSTRFWGPVPNLLLLPTLARTQFGRRVRVDVWALKGAFLVFCGGSTNMLVCWRPLLLRTDWCRRLFPVPSRRRLAATDIGSGDASRTGPVLESLDYCRRGRGTWAEASVSIDSSQISGAGRAVDIRLIASDDPQLQRLEHERAAPKGWPDGRRQPASSLRKQAAAQVRANRSRMDSVDPTCRRGLGNGG